MGDGMARAGAARRGKAAAGGERPSRRSRNSALGAGTTLSLAAHLVVVGVVALSTPKPLALSSARSMDNPDSQPLNVDFLALDPHAEIPPESADDPPPLPLPSSWPSAAIAARTVEKTAARLKAPRLRARANLPTPRPAPTNVADTAAGSLPMTSVDADLEVASGSQPTTDAPQPDMTDTPTVSAASAPEPAAAVAAPSHVDPYIARSLRLYDVFPRIPEPLRTTQGEHAMTVDVCVSERGQVSQVNITPGNVDLLVRALREAVQTWRYRPLMVAGTARPFCHVMRVVYRVGSA